MKVFKFGGASVRDASAVRNVVEIMKRYSSEKILVVVSAMGKTTNALEDLTDAYFHRREEAPQILERIREFHNGIIEELFPDKSHTAREIFHNAFVELEWVIEDAPTHEYNHEYDQIVCMGEVLSTLIVSEYLRASGIANLWWDARDLIKTDNNYREGNVDWEQTEELISGKVAGEFLTSEKNVIITQGFIGGTSENFTTTLGREGSDYTAAIIAFCSNASEVIIWKDVPGVLNADPKWFDDTQLLPEITYQDAIELAYYGASVIHPKTIKPLQNKKIPLYVKSFKEPSASGTLISDVRHPLPIASFITKPDQLLISISPKDFSFIAEDNLSGIFNCFSKHHVKINVMLNSAISFSVSVDNDSRKIPALIDELKEDFRVLYNENLELVTIRYYDQATIDRVTSGKEILLEVKSRYTFQVVTRST